MALKRTPVATRASNWFCVIPWPPMISTVSPASKGSRANSPLPWMGEGRTSTRGSSQNSERYCTGVIFYVRFARKLYAGIDVCQPQLTTDGVQRQNGLASLRRLLVAPGAVHLPGV